MPITAGRTSDSRTVAGVVTTNASAALTAPAASFNEEDAGRPISGAGIPAGATILSVASPTAATLSANATASATVTATVGSAATSEAAALSNGFLGFSPETDAESETYSVAANNAGTPSPDRITAHNDDQRAKILRSRA